VVLVRTITRHLFFILLMFLVFANRNEAFAGPCDTCAKIGGKLAEFRARRNDLQRLLGRNQQALDQSNRQGAGEASKQIKLTSNIFIITVELETIENNEQRVNAFAGRIGCSRCPR
jgi:hypothetical protein